ncbi:MAG: ABC transporter substrate-binding protein [Candidatus Eremiobacteraeota bacterium]|nr:ABC transporter substrate-binding protein [Candidatus Eremiobacteraeota bacterium]
MIALCALAAALRIVSIIPSLTEDLFALGAGASVVAVSEFSDYPAAAKKLPRVATFSTLDAERIVELHPDLVVGIRAQAPIVGPLARAHLRVELFDDDTFADIFRTLRRLGALVGRAPQAAALERRLRDETARLRRDVDPKRKPSVFVVLGVAPIFTVGRRSYIATLIELAGGRNAARIDAAYDRYTAEALLAAQPDLIVADPEAGLRAVLDQEPWRSLSAVRRRHVADIENPGVLLRPGPRYNEGLRWLIREFRLL